MILLRHGQSAFNLHFGATGEDPGIPDAPLTPLGQAQAEAAAAALAGEGIRRILCSPYTRALQTAAPIARRLDLPVTVTPVVRERCSASCDIGTPRTELALAWPALDQHTTHDLVTGQAIAWDVDGETTAIGLPGRGAARLRTVVAREAGQAVDAALPALFTPGYLAFPPGASAPAAAC